jgi:putative phosphoribosyl transferase
MALAGEHTLQIVVPSIGLTGELARPDQPKGVVIIAHGGRPMRTSPRNRKVARELADAGLAVFSFDLLDEAEYREPSKSFDIELLTQRFVGAVEWARARPDLEGLRVGLMAIHTGAAAALRAAVEEHETIRAVVSRGGRPDLAGPLPSGIDVALLLVVAEQDERLLGLNLVALTRMGGPRRLEIVEGATHFFEEPGALERVTELAKAWFLEHLAGPGRPAAGAGQP